MLQINYGVVFAMEWSSRLCRSQHTGASDFAFEVKTKQQQKYDDSDVPCR